MNYEQAERSNKSCDGSNSSRQIKYKLYNFVQVLSIANAINIIVVTMVE